MLWIADLPWPGYRNYNGDIFSRAHGLVNKPDPTRITKATYWAPMPAAPDESRADTSRSASQGAAISAPDGAQGE